MKKILITLIFLIILMGCTQQQTATTLPTTTAQTGTQPVVHQTQTQPPATQPAPQEVKTMKFSLNDGQTAVLGFEEDHEIILKQVHSDKSVDLLIDNKGQFNQQPGAVIKITEDTELKFVTAYYNVVVPGEGSLVRFILMTDGGAVQAALHEGEEQVFKIGGEPYRIKASIVSSHRTEPVVKFEINGRMTDTLMDGESDYFIPGAKDRIIVLEILPQEAQETTRKTYAEFELRSKQ